MASTGDLENVADDFADVSSLPFLSSNGSNPSEDFESDPFVEMNELKPLDFESGLKIGFCSLTEFSENESKPLFCPAANESNPFEDLKSAPPVETNESNPFCCCPFDTGDTKLLPELSETESKPLFGAATSELNPLFPFPAAKESNPELGFKSEPRFGANESKLVFWL